VLDRDRTPTIPKLLAATIAVGVIWGFAFGLIDDDLWTGHNWAWAAEAAALWFVLVFAWTRFKARRTRSR
jgi:membrane associated rhomboid family serine protease